MADFNYDEFDSGYQESSADTQRLAEKARRWVNIAGAVCSVSLLIGVAFWGYQLAVRDVTGVPVMRAAAGAMRVAPADPGGEQALNQGLTVNAIAAMGTSAAPADQITLAPGAVTLQDGDVPQPVAQAAEATPLAPDAGVTLAGSSDVSALVDGILATDAAPADAEPDVELATLVTSDPNAIRHSLRPQPRPASMAGKSAPTKVQNVSSQGAAAAKEIDPAAIPVGTRLAQLGAFETPELARERFVELQVTFGDLMIGKDIVIQSATSGGRTFYRLRAHGFATDEDARSFCSALLAEETDCIPVAQR
jgi:hypothetical protein